MKRNLKVKVLFFSLISVGIINARTLHQDVLLSAIREKSVKEKGYTRTLHQNLLSAIREKNTEEVRNLIKGYDRPGLRKGTPPLIFAASIATTEDDDKIMAKITTILLKNNQSPTVQDKSRMTPLMWAAKNGAIEVVGALLRTKEGKTTINMQDNVDNTALIHAAMGSDTDKRHLAVAKKLLQKKAKHSITNNRGKTALSCAKQAGNREMINLLHSYKAR